MRAACEREALGGQAGFPVASQKTDAGAWTCFICEPPAPRRAIYRSFDTRCPSLATLCCSRSPHGCLPEELFADADGVVRRRHSVPDRARVLKDLVVVPTGHGLVPEEVDFLEALVLHEAQSVRLVPPAPRREV